MPLPIKVGLLALLALFSIQAEAQKPDAEALRIEKTGVELAHNSLSPDSRAFLQKELLSPRSGARLAAEAKLLWAMNLRLFSQPRLLKLIERQTDTADLWWGVLHAGNYGRTLGLTVGGNSSLNQAGLILTTRRKPANELSIEERAFFERCLKAGTFGGRIDSVYAIFPKRGLSASDLKWIVTRLRAEAGRHSGAEREFWQYAVRVVHVRNAPSKPVRRGPPRPVRIRLQ